MTRRGRAGHVELSEGSLVLREFPFIQEAECAHAKGEDGWHGGRSGEEGGGAQHSAVTAECCGYIDLSVENGRQWFVRGSSDSPQCCVEREWKESMKVVRRYRLKDEGYKGVICVDMFGKFQDRFCCLGCVFLLHQQYVSRRGRPSER